MPRGSQEAPRKHFCNKAGNVLSDPGQTVQEPPKRVVAAALDWVAVAAMSVASCFSGARGASSVTIFKGKLLNIAFPGLS